MNKILEDAIKDANNEATCQYEYYINIDAVSKYSPIFKCKQGHDERIECNDSCPDYKGKEILWK